MINTNKGRRRIPSQERSKLTVDSILDAAAGLVASRGYKYATTRRIAYRAGVPVSSLYQYFANRDAIMLALYEQAASKTARAMREVILDKIDAPLDDALRAITLTLLQASEQNGLILSRLTEEIPDLMQEFHALSVYRLFLGPSRIFLEQHGVTESDRCLEQMLFFIRNIASSTVNEFLKNPPEYMSRDEFVDEYVRVMSTYIRSRSTDQT